MQEKYKRQRQRQCLFVQMYIHMYVVLVGG